MDRVKNQRELNSKLKGSTLGEKSGDDKLAAKDWVRKQAKRAKMREKELAERRRKEMEEDDQAIYDERELVYAVVGGKELMAAGDLAGLKVGHGAEDFEAGEDIVLTLKDSRVLAGDGAYPNYQNRFSADESRG